jgi:hypothetical protein
VPTWTLGRPSDFALGGPSFPGLRDTENRKGQATRLRPTKHAVEGNPFGRPSVVRPRHAWRIPKAPRTNSRGVGARESVGLCQGLFRSGTWEPGRQPGISSQRCRPIPDCVVRNTDFAPEGTPPALRLVARGLAERRAKPGFGDPAARRAALGTRFASANAHGRDARTCARA